MDHSDNVRAIRAELEALGHKTRMFTTDARGPVVCFEYTIEVGSRQGQRITLGLSMYGSGLYPEYPPHWIHVSPPINDNRGGAVEQYVDTDGNEWIAMSRPPGDLWDALPTKRIDVFLTEHVRRFWATI